MGLGLLFLRWSVGLKSGSDEQMSQVTVKHFVEVYACLNFFQFMLGNNEFDFELVCEISIFDPSHSGVLTHI